MSLGFTASSGFRRQIAASPQQQYKYLVVYTETERESKILTATRNAHEYVLVLVLHSLRQPALRKHSDYNSSSKVHAYLVLVLVVYNSKPLKQRIQHEPCFAYSHEDR